MSNRDHLVPVGTPAGQAGLAQERSADVERSHSLRRTGRGRVARRVLVAGRLATAAVVATAVGLALPSSVGEAAGSGPAPSLKVLLARAAKISNEIDLLGQQYDALRIQLAAAYAQIKIARETLRRDKAILAVDQSAIAGIAAAGYMAGSVNPSLQLLESANPQAMLDRASILSEIQHQNATKMGLVAAADAAA